MSGQLRSSTRPRSPGSFIDTLDAATRLQRHPAIAFGLLTLLYLIAIICLSWVKLLWLDELITLHIVQLNSVSAIWHALGAGADPNPPLLHLLVMFSRRLFGEHALALRLPAVIGYWVGMLALFLFLKRRVTVAWALTGTVLSMGMGGFEWSYESRSYAIFYGLAMLALYCWSQAAQTWDFRTRCLALIGLTAALAGGICVNYFAVLSFLPVASAEVTRTVIAARGSRSPMTKHVDWAMWVAITIAAAPLVVFLPLIQRSIALYQAYAWNKVSFDGVVASYVDMIGSLGYPLLALLVVAASVSVIARFAPDRYSAPLWVRQLAADYWLNRRNARLLPLPEQVSVFVFVFYPFVGYCVASLRGGMLSPRFVIPVCFGGAIVCTAVAARVFGHVRSASTISLILALLWFAGRESYIGYNYEVQKESFYRMLSRIPPPEYRGEPIVVSDNLLVLPFQYYAPPRIASRVAYPVDFSGIMRSRGEASGEVNLWEGRDIAYHFPILPLASFQAQTSSYLVVSSGPRWLVDDLLRHRYKVEHLDIDSEAANLQFEATPLSHDKPEFFRAGGDLLEQPDTIPFDPDNNAPKAK